MMSKSILLDCELTHYLSNSSDYVRFSVSDVIRAKIEGVCLLLHR